MLKLVAISAGDGWALVRDNGVVVMARPPYRKDGLVNVHEQDIASALARQGFAATDRDFDDWRSLTDFLKDELIRSRREMGQKIELDKLHDLITLAPPEILKQYLDRIEVEVVPRGECRAAITVLARLLELEKVKSDTQLKAKAEQLLRNCKTKEALKKESRLELLDPEQEIKRKFPRIIRRYLPHDIYAKTESVKKNGQLLALGH